MIERSSIAFALLGVVLIWHLPQSTWILLVATLAWITLYWRQIGRLRSGWQYCCAIRVVAGPAFEVQNRDGDWVPAELESGSLVSDRVAWLRLSTNQGLRIVELLLRSRRRCNRWRRLRVIWRHIGAT